MKKMINKTAGKVWVLGSVFLIFLVFALSVISQGIEPPAVEWKKNLGGDERDEGYSVQQTSDQGYIIAGRTKSFGSGDYDAYLVKTDSLGELEWQKTFGGDKEDIGRSIQQTSDQGYIITGWTKSFGTGLLDVYLIKIDSRGELEWQKNFGGNFGGEMRDIGLSVQETSDHGYIITGETELGTGIGSALYLVKTDTNGEIQWQKIFGGKGCEIGYSVQQTSDHGYIIVGTIESSYGSGELDVYLVKTDSLGELEWQKTFGGDKEDIGFSVQQTSDQGYIIAGWTKSFCAKGHEDYETYEVYLVKTDSQGELEWQKNFGREWNYIDMYWNGAYSVQETFDKGYIVVGWENSHLGGGKYTVYLARTDTFGNLLWQKSIKGFYTGYGYCDAYAWSIDQTSDKGYIIAGFTNTRTKPDVYLIKTAGPTPYPDIDCQPWNLDFGEIGVGTSLDLNYELWNQGYAELMVDILEIEGRDANEFGLIDAPELPLIVTTNTCQLITVRFQPSGSGEKIAWIETWSNDPDENPFTSPTLTGIGCLGPNEPPQIQLLSPTEEKEVSTTAFVIRWTDEDPDDDAQICLYYDTDKKGRDGILIVSGLSEDDETDIYEWDTKKTPEKVYWVYAVIDDGHNPPVYSYSMGSVMVSHITKQEIIDHILGKKVLPEERLPFADLNGDGYINISDVIKATIIY